MGHSEKEGQEEAVAVLLVRADEGSLDPGSEKRDAGQEQAGPPCVLGLLDSSLSFTLAPRRTRTLARSGCGGHQHLSCKQASMWHITRIELVV